MKPLTTPEADVDGGKNGMQPITFGIAADSNAGRQNVHSGGLIAFLVLALVAVFAGLVGGCTAGSAPKATLEATLEATDTDATVRGHVYFAALVQKPRNAQATLTEVANAATVSLIDAVNGNTVGSSVTDASGSFVLTFKAFNPVSGAPYTLEAVKGLAVGGSPNRAGAAALRVRTLLFWNSGWQSLTNTVVGQGIVVSSATTAIATIVSLKQQAGVTLTLSTLIGTVSGSTFAEGGTGLSNANDFVPVLGLISNAILLDQDPVGSVAFDKIKGNYTLASGVPAVNSISPPIPIPGGTLTIKGTNFESLAGRMTLWFGSIPAATWSTDASRSALTVTVPANATSAPFTMQQVGGVLTLLSSFLFLQGTVGNVAGTGLAGFYDSQAIAAEFNNPYGVAVDTTGIVYVADSSNNRIRKISTSGVVSTLAGNGTAGYVDGLGASAQFNGPLDVTVGPGGIVYVGDIGNHRIRTISVAGVVSTLAGSGVAGFADGTGTAAQFNSPRGLALDTGGNLYVADDGNHRIRKITPAGVVSTLAGSGAAAFADGTGASASFNRPLHVAVDSSDNVYVTDNLNRRIRKMTPAGVVSTLAGSGIAGYADGAGASASFNIPVGIAVTTAGTVYVGDFGNHRIRAISATGVVSTLAGDGIASYLDGSLLTARFNYPSDVALAQNGALYVADTSNHRIRGLAP